MFPWVSFSLKGNGDIRKIFLLIWTKIIGPFSIAMVRASTTELPHYKYFKWANGSEYKQKALVKREAELLKREEELQKREEEIGKRELTLHNDQA
ncbi:hypothetical protein I3843_08G128700 [Carya illinoinensis]|nr:hypothetical protein I3843_08G128700 [Carya illinoinensis]